MGRIPGTGIGLFGARQIAEQHGGRIEVKSVEGQGSTFSVWLPQTPPPDQEEKELDTQAPSMSKDQGHGDRG